ncbi:hypothetical protein [Pseudoteredinibacter isoporae]|uniref:Uncharacterized protein n=1 Tax=Pseudoteredinibacter isoporae TaxID=570281 RepID=A0A7X0JVV2_9GAMM|nr:hypothetical protein [Pseudoteredinibacter isoporae]MBB6522749.1 hypothetical protein [Pseudoteredinibacter isoporae]NHO88278.1 hypothetical protein [Pseudoteredinibacter isoporae]NIB23391.1 hypothetical protein [Pseudoteredinibacter isoporae]
MEFLILIVLSTVILASVIVVLSLVKTPHYRLDALSVENFLLLVINGQATENDWSVFTSVPIRHNPELEAIRLRCVELEEHYYLGQTRSGHLLSQAGIQVIEQLLQELREKKA